MGMFSFIKEVGEKPFGIAEAAQPSAALNKAAADASGTYIHSMGLQVAALNVRFDAASGVVTVFGVAPDQATREKVVLCCGKVSQVIEVNDLMTVGAAAPESQRCTVVKGDNLSKISKQFYGNPNKCPQIFEAYKPMLSHPDKIYPGQVLRMPTA